MERHHLPRVPPSEVIGEAATATRRTRGAAWHELIRIRSASKETIDIIFDLLSHPCGDLEARLALPSWQYKVKYDWPAEEHSVAILGGTAEGTLVTMLFAQNKKPESLAHHYISSISICRSGQQTQAQAMDKSQVKPILVFELSTAPIDKVTGKGALSVPENSEESSSGERSPPPGLGAGSASAQGARQLA